MKVVVTGATGHLGRSVVERFARAGCAVVAVSRSGRAPEPPFGHPALPRMETLAVDLCSDAAVGALADALGPEVTLVHLAGSRPPGTSDSTRAARSALLDLDVMGTQRALEAASRAGVRAVIYASSAEVYGIPQTPDAVSEESATRPISDYGVVKLSGEDHLFAFAAESAVRAVALRFPAIYGPGERVSRALPSFLRAVAAGRVPVVSGDGSEQCDQVHAADAALAIERAATTDASGVFNVTDGEAHSVRALAATALEAAGLSGAPEHHPSTKPCDGAHLSIERARRVLGFQPEVPLAEGMREQLAWLRASGEATA